MAADPPEPRLLDVSMAGEVNVVDDDDDEDVDVGELERCDLAESVAAVRLALGEIDEDEEDRRRDEEASSHENDDLDVDEVE